jgi:mono/diheme cytochrome c family protein
MALLLKRHAWRGVVAAIGLTRSLLGADAAGMQLERQFTQTVRPFLAAYCVSCHGATNPAAQFDMREYSSGADAVRDHERWALLAGKLAAMEMPPKAMKQPSAAERQQVIEWVHAMRASEARKNAGDPGVVLVRRLSNAEYNYSIRDLTGVDIRPTREFPVDPANPAGFDNSGESLAMSPALLSKYLQAAREVAAHMVLKPTGFDFAPHPMLAESDREKYTIQRIVDFYDRQPTDYADYFEAAWRFKHRAALGKPEAGLADFAREAKISPKYLPLVWGILEEAKEDAGPVARLRTMWRMLPGPEHKQMELIREGCAKMRDYVVKIRKLTARQFRSPKVQGLAGTSQPLMNWKLRAYAANRRDFDRAALQVEGEPPLALPVMPRMTGVPTEDQVGLRNAALAIRARFGDPDLLVPAGQRERYEASFATFSSVFPDAFYIRERGRFYPDDSEDKGRLLSAGFHNVMGYFRDDTPLMELILDEQGQKDLDRLWLEFDTIADFTTRTYVQFFFNQSGEIDGRGRESGSFRPSDKEVTSEAIIFGIRDTYLTKAETAGDELAKQAIREHFARVNATIRLVEKTRLEAEPSHLEALLRFATRAYRRPLSQHARDDLLSYYRSLRDKSGLSHEDAMRDTVVLVLMSPDFTLRADVVSDREGLGVPTKKPAPRIRTASAKAAAGKTLPMSGHALASRISYFLWASLPDEELMARAAAGDLRRPEILVAQIRRMLKDKRSLALATEFAGNWLDFRRFEDHNSVDRGRFPEFTNELRQAMFEEPVRFIDDVIRNDRPVLDLLYGKHTFVNRVLARHYDIPDVRIKPGEWVRIDDARRYGRGGLLPMAVFLTRNSPGLRTSPVKRGYWVARQVLGEVIPPPPPAVPELPGDEAKMDLPLRQMLARHRDHSSCAGCHQRFDGFGLAFEGYGPVGEQRTNDLAGRPVDTRAEFPGGGQGTGVDGLVEHLRARREKDFVNTLCRKILVYALGRGLQLSDEPLLEQMRSAFLAGGHRFSALIESIVVSPQFLNQRNPEYREKGD